MKYFTVHRVKISCNTKQHHLLILLRLCYGRERDLCTRSDSSLPQRIHLRHRRPIANDDQTQPGARPHDVQPSRVIHKPNLARHIAPHGGEHDDVALPSLEGVDRRAGHRGREGAFEHGNLFAVGREGGDGQFGLSLLFVLVSVGVCGGLKKRDDACDELDLAFVALGSGACRLFEGALHKDGWHESPVYPRPWEGGGSQSSEDGRAVLDMRLKLSVVELCRREVG